MTAQTVITKLKADVAEIVTDAAGVSLPALPTLSAQVDALVPDAPPTTQPLDALAIYDGPKNTAKSPPGGVSKNFLYQYWLPWKNVGGDWIDAAGVAQGTTPFATLVDVTGKLGTISTDVTTLVKQTTNIVLRGVGSETATFYSRESSIAPGPTLVYDTPGGQVSHTATADTPCNTSTEYEMGDGQTISISSAISVYLAFPAPPAGWTKATLVLTMQQVWTGGKINVYKFTWGGISYVGDPNGGATLKGDSRVCFETESFEDIPDYLHAMIFGDPIHSAGLDIYNQKAVVNTSAGRALQITFDPRINGALTAAVMFPNGVEVTEAAWEFEACFLPDMLTGLTQGFKFFAGASSATKPDDAYFSHNWGTQVGRAGTLLAGNGGAKSHGNDGWSTRFDMFAPPDAGHPLAGHFAPMQYVYWPEQSSFYGDPHLWNGAGFTAAVNEWHRYKMRLKVNSCVGTVYQKDAELDCYLDGVLAHSWRGFYLRTTDDPLIMHAPYNVGPDGKTYDVKSQLKIARIWLNTYHGGLALPAARCSFQVRNLRAAILAA